MVAKETIATGERVEYVWDHRNRLISIVSKHALGAVTQKADQAYDVFQRWVHRSVDSDGAGPASATDTFFTHEGNQIALEFDGNTASDLAHRYLWGDMVDQILADEQVSSLASAGDVIYPLTDHLNTTRDLATYDAGTDVTTNANHRRFDSFGNLISQTNGSITILVSFTARPLDVATGLQLNLNRWYVSTLGTWMSEAPIGFEAGDGNVRRYTINAPLLASDPTGPAQQEKFDIDTGGPNSGWVMVTIIPAPSFFAASWDRDGIPYFKESKDTCDGLPSIAPSQVPKNAKYFIGVGSDVKIVYRTDSGKGDGYYWVQYLKSKTTTIKGSSQSGWAIDGGGGKSWSKDAYSGQNVFANGADLRDTPGLTWGTTVDNHKDKDGNTVVCPTDDVRKMLIDLLPTQREEKAVTLWEYQTYLVDLKSGKPIGYVAWLVTVEFGDNGPVPSDSEPIWKSSVDNSVWGK